MEVETSRSLNGTLQQLLRIYGNSGDCSNISGIENILKNDSNGVFQIPAADTAKSVIFNNRELLCRFTSLPHEYQFAFLDCIRRAMMKEKVLMIHIEASWSSANKRLIKVQQVQSGGLTAYGEGPLRFF